MRDLSEIQCFVKAVEMKSLSAGAKTLSLPKSTMSRKIKSLEERLGLTLMIRNTRSLNLTEAGKGYYERSAMALKELDAAEDALNTSRQIISGTLRITAPVEFATGHFNRLIASFIKEHPEVQVETLFTERVVDLISEGFDIAFRVGFLEDSGFIAKKLKGIEAQIVGSTAYLKKRGMPKVIADLEKHDCLGFAPEGPLMKWILKGPTGKKEFTPKHRFLTNQILSLKGAVLNDLGLALLPNYLVEPELERKEAKVVLPEWSFIGQPFHLVFPSRKFLSPAMRAFIDAAEKHPLF
jgi:DNA-binding transcriptional LysR family regulator